MCLVNEQKGNGLCLGAASLSPGNYLSIKYVNAVKALQMLPATPAPNVEVEWIVEWCFYVEKDPDINVASVCKSASGPRYRAIAYPSQVHCMQMIDAKAQPNTMQLILDWIKLSFGL